MLELSDALVKELEKDLLKIVASSLRNGSLALPDARSACQAYLSMLPYSTFDDFKNKIKAYSTTYKPFSKLYIDLLHNEEKYRMDNVLTRMRLHLHNNEVDKALHIAKNN